MVSGPIPWLSVPHAWNPPRPAASRRVDTGSANPSKSELGQTIPLPSTRLRLGKFLASTSDQVLIVFWTSSCSQNCPHICSNKLQQLITILGHVFCIWGPKPVKMSQDGPQHWSKRAKIAKIFAFDHMRLVLSFTCFLAHQTSQGEQKESQHEAATKPVES